MGDGWETKEKRIPGHDWVILKLAVTGKIKRINVDTNFFKGNYPDRCSIEDAYCLMQMIIHLHLRKLNGKKFCPKQN